MGTPLFHSCFPLSFPQHKGVRSNAGSFVFEQEKVNYQFNDIVCMPRYNGEQIVKRGEYSNDRYGQDADRG